MEPINKINILNGTFFLFEEKKLLVPKCTDCRNFKIPIGLNRLKWICFDCLQKEKEIYFMSKKET